MVLVSGLARILGLALFTYSGMGDFLMNAETIKTLFRPFLTLFLVATWVIFIAKGIDYPPMFQWLAAGSAGEWVLERGWKRLLEMKG